MFSKDLWQEIFHSIKNNKLRTFLTGFSVGWGIFILVLLLASVKGMQNGFYKQFNDDASNAIFIWPSVTKKPYAGFDAGRLIKLTNSDIDFIKNNYQGMVEYITPRISRAVDIRYKNEQDSYRVRGVAPDHLYTEKTIIAEGRYLNDADIINKAKVIVIGRKLSKDLFNRTDNVVGQTVFINNLPFLVIGIFTDEGSDREERYAYVPYTTFQRIYGNVDTIDQIVLTYNPKFSLEKALAFSNLMETDFKRKFKIHPDDQGAIYFNNSAEGFSDISNFSNLLRWVSIFVGVLILIAGIVGIGNILVFIIKERTKEIGVRKAIGAKPFDIIRLVLLESVFITTISGFIGLLLATGIVVLIAPFMDFPAFANPSVDNTTVISATIILIVAGLIAGLIPALRAANVKPIEALRAD